MRRYHGFDRSIRAGIVQALLTRDGSNCGICETALDSSAGPDHPASTTIDHVVPISEGGEFGHETAIGNLRLAHSFCNTKLARCPDYRAAWFARELRRAALETDAAKTRTPNRHATIYGTTRVLRAVINLTRSS